jgi:hypothetical protein
LTINSGTVSGYTFQNSVDYGIGIDYISGTQEVIVRFGTYTLANGATFGAVGQTYAAGPVGGGYWRVRKTSGGQAVGFGTVSATSSGLMPASNSNLDDATATRLGLKQYLHGTTYNGGNAPTVAVTNLSTCRGTFVPYQMQDGTWRMRFNIGLLLSAGATSISATVNGIAVNSSYPDFQSVSAIGGSGNSYTFGTIASTNTISAGTASASTQWAISGDVELDSKPTWAY